HRILEIERRFAPDDWKQFARELRFSRAGEFYYYAEDPATGLADSTRRDVAPRPPAPRGGFTYRLSKFTHGAMFTPGTLLSRWGTRACANARDPRQGPSWMRVVEHASKAVLF